MTATPMSPGRHAAHDDSELPSFSGDLPEDVALTGRLLRRRFHPVLARRATGVGVACALVLAIYTAVEATVSRTAPVEQRPVPVIIALLAAALACGATSLAGPVPGRVRFVLGAVPAAALLHAAAIAGGSHELASGYTRGALGLATLVTGVTYMAVAGLRFSSHFRRLAAAARPPSTPPGG